MRAYPELPEDSDPHDGARLDELDREEFREATRPLWRKGYTDADFDAAWAEFQEMKRRRQMQ